MIAALLCPGPSLRASWVGRGGYGLVLAVNRAPLLVPDPVDVWAFQDWHVFTDYRPGYRPGVLTNRTCAEAIKRKRLQDELDQHAVAWTEDIAFKPAMSTGWRIYTKGCAMVHAHALGADELHVYGDGMSGEADADGHTDERNNRRDERWERERSITEDLRGWLWAYGTKVAWID